MNNKGKHIHNRTDPLTPEQARLAAEHIKLVSWVIGRLHFQVKVDINLLQWEKLHDELLDCFLQCVRYYNSSMGKFSTYCVRSLYRRSWGFIGDEQKKMKSHPRIVFMGEDYDSSEKALRGEETETSYPDEVKEKLEKVINSLKPQSKDIICRYYGLRGHEPHSRREISKIYGCSRQNISERIKTAIHVMYVKMETLK